MAEIIDIFEQVDEELEADEVRKFWEKYRDWIIAGLILFFAALSGYVMWQEYRLRQDQQASDTFLMVLQNLRQGEAGRQEALERLQSLEQSHHGHGYAQLGGLVRARVLADQGKQVEALQALEQVVEMAGSSPVADLALLNAAYLVSADPAKVEGYLGRMGLNSAFHGQAMELRSVLALRAGNREAALEMTRQILEQAPKNSDLRARLMLRLERLGGGTTVVAAGKGKE